MKAITKRRLKVYLPIAITVILAIVIVAIILLNNKITAKDYFNALSQSNFTKQVQNTTIFEEDLLVYEKVETIIRSGENVYHKIEEKQISEQVGVEYDLNVSEFYYSKDKMYYFEDNVWKTQDFTISTKLKTYFLQTDYFSTLEFTKKVETEGRLKGNIKDSAVNKIVSDTSLNNMSVLIVVNKNFNVKKFEITAKTTTGRDVLISNVYTYNTETVTLPA